MHASLESFSANRSTARLKLPDVTLVVIETREHALARIAIADCLDKAEFGEVLILTDRPLEFSPLTMSHGVHPRFHVVDDWPDKLGYCQSWWYDVPLLLRTSHSLSVEWDGGIWDTGMWRDEYMEYDYVGAPWWYKDGKNVGNGGFCLISSRLRRYVHDRRAQYVCDMPIGDDLLCRKYRPNLENVGFRWAPEKLAHEFSFECCRPSPTSRHFGFHAVYNWQHVMNEAALIERLIVALQSDYVSKGRMIQVLWENRPDLPKKIAHNIRKNHPDLARKIAYKASVKQKESRHARI
jgi:Protein of unknown function (DUF5672)